MAHSQIGKLMSMVEVWDMRLAGCGVKRWGWVSKGGCRSSKAAAQCGIVGLLEKWVCRTERSGPFLIN